MKYDMRIVWCIHEVISVFVSTLILATANSCGARTSIADPANAAVGNGAIGGATNAGNAKFLQVSAGQFHVCGIKTDGTVACWGDNNNGQGSPPGGTFLQVSASDVFTCGVKTDGTVVCWGDDKYGQASPPSGTFLQVSAGGSFVGSTSFACGLRTDGTLACWGSGGNTVNHGTFTEVSASEAGFCALMANGTPYCAGSIPSGPDITFSQLSVGVNSICGLTPELMLTCWGEDTYGTTSPPDAKFLQVSAGWYHDCGVRSDGTLACWGTASPLTRPSRLVARLRR